MSQVVLPLSPLLIPLPLHVGLGKKIPNKPLTEDTVSAGDFSSQKRLPRQSLGNRCHPGGRRAGVAG